MNRAMFGLGLLLAGCSGTNNHGDTQGSEAGNDVVAANATPAKSSSPVVSQFTRDGLKPCRIIDKNEAEGPYYRHLCPGVGGYKYEVVESDLRQTMVIVAPGGARSELGLNRIGGGGFSVLGPVMDWRGPAGAPPQALVVRYNVQQGEAGSDKSFLVVVRLNPTACIIGSVPPGPGQNERAREIADGAGDCLR